MDYFYTNQTLILPDLADRLNLSSDKFIVKQRFDGGMGSCYRIESADGKSYALKVIHTDLLTDKNSIARYYDEIKLWLTFSACDGVAEAVFIVRINEVPCVVSTWMNGGDMSNLIKTTSIDAFYRTMDRIATSLKWVNDKFNVIHRDLKPGNILIDENMNAYVADWGLAKLISNKENNSSTVKELSGINPQLTTKGSFVGTVLYASPEQLLGLPNIDHRSDIYSLGCIMYQWETGNPPFVANTIQEIASGHLYNKPNKIRGIFKRTHFKAEDIIMKCLEKNPNDRYQTYDQLLRDLHRNASKYCQNFQPYVVQERHQIVNIGHDDLSRRVKSRDIGLFGNKGVGVVDQSEIQPYLNEAVALSAIGEYQKAIEIYRRLFIPNLVRQFPDMDHHQFIVVNLAHALNSINESKEALNTILTLADAKLKPSTYFVNLSNIYISLQEFDKCISTCEDGLRIYPNDNDLIGNYTIGLVQVGRLNDAVKSAQTRLSLSRDVHALCEAGYTCYQYAESLKNVNFPEAIRFYKDAMALYREALGANPTYKDAMYNVALLLFKMKRYSDALNYGVEISNIEQGTSPLNAFYAARNMLWTSNFATTIDFCDRWMKSYPDYILLKRVRAEALVDGFVIGNYSKEGYPIVEDSSLDFFTEIIKDEKNRIASDFIFLAKIYCWLNGQEEINYGMSLLENGKRLYPNNWKFNFYLSAFAHKYKQPQKALSEAIECQRKAPWRETVYDILSMAYSANGNEQMSQKMKLEFERIRAEKTKLYDSCKTV